VLGQLLPLVAGHVAHEAAAGLGGGDADHEAVAVADAVDVGPRAVEAVRHGGRHGGHLPPRAPGELPDPQAGRVQVLGEHHGVGRGAARHDVDGVLEVDGEDAGQLRERAARRVAGHDGARVAEEVGDRVTVAGSGRGHDHRRVLLGRAALHVGGHHVPGLAEEVDRVVVAAAAALRRRVGVAGGVVPGLAGERQGALPRVAGRVEDRHGEVREVAREEGHAVVVAGAGAVHGDGLQLLLRALQRRRRRGERAGRARERVGDGERARVRRAVEDEAAPRGHGHGGRGPRRGAAKPVPAAAGGVEGDGAGGGVGVGEHEEPGVTGRDAGAGVEEGRGLRGGAPAAADGAEAEVGGRREAREDALEHVVVEVPQAAGGGGRRRGLALPAAVVVGPRRLHVAMAGCERDLCEREESKASW